MFTTTRAAAGSNRFTDIKATLEARRRELAQDLRSRIRTVRSDAVTERDVVDDAERSEADIQDELGLAVLQLAAGTLANIDDALRRIEAGDYGECFECGDDIPDARLRALPFAARCRGCEALREAADRGGRTLGWRDVSAPFADPGGERSLPVRLARLS